VANAKSWAEPAQPFDPGGLGGPIRVAAEPPRARPGLYKGPPALGKAAKRPPGENGAYATCRAQLCAGMMLTKI
jgi:hypothetical protein